MEIKFLKEDSYVITLNSTQLKYIEKMLGDTVQASTIFDDHVFYASFSNKVQAAFEDAFLKKKK